MAQAMPQPSRMNHMAPRDGGGEAGCTSPAGGTAASAQCLKVVGGDKHHKLFCPYWHLEERGKDPEMVAWSAGRLGGLMKLLSQGSREDLGVNF